MKEMSEPTNRGNQYKEISVKEFKNLLESGQKEFSEYRIMGKYGNYVLFKGKVINDVVFDDCIFYGINFGNNVIKNCSFNDCHFDFCYIHNNIMSDSYINNVALDFFDSVQSNSFDNVKGSIGEYTGFNSSNKNNVFRNMNLDGFIDVIFVNTFNGGALRWENNFFLNSNISMDAIKRIAYKARYIWNGSNDWDMSEPRDLVEEVEESDEEDSKENDSPWGKRGTEVTEWSGPDLFAIDMENMSEKGRINLVGSLLTKFCGGSMIIEHLKFKMSPNSTIEFHTSPNPCPIKIISSNGKIIDSSKLRDINISAPFIPNIKNGGTPYLSYDGAELEPLFQNESDITNQQDLCMQLVNNSKKMS